MLQLSVFTMELAISSSTAVSAILDLFCACQNDLFGWKVWYVAVYDRMTFFWDHGHSSVVI